MLNDLVNLGNTFSPMKIFQILHGVIYKWNLKEYKWIIYKTETDSQIKQTWGYQRGKRKGEGQIYGLGWIRHRQLYVRQWDTLYSLGNDTHYLLINCNGI